MRSVKMKLLISLFFISIFFTLCTGFTMLVLNQKALKSDAKEIITQLCENEAKKIDEVLSSVEQSVDIMAKLAIEKFVGLELLKDEEKLNAYNEEMVGHFLEICKETETYHTIYYRYNIEKLGPSAGFWYGLDNGVMTKLTPTNLSLYDANDIKNAAWYHLPYKTKKSCWIEPFFNDDTNSYIISYSTPIYYNNEFVGVIGMEVDLSYIINMVKEIEMYENGQAYIVKKNNKIAYHEILKYQQDRQPVAKKYLEVETKLKNEMSLVITAPINSITAHGLKNNVKIYVYLSIFLAAELALIALIVLYVSKPVDKIAEAAESISNGKYDVEFDINSKDQYQDISEAFQAILEDYKDRIESVNKLAFKDQLTGVLNKIAYADHSLRINKNFGKNPFAVVVLHLYNLIPMNDRFGREMGNEFLLSATSYIESIYGNSNIYRLTGGLFAIILENNEFDRREELYNEFIENLSDESIIIEQEEINLPIAIGMAEYNKYKDKSVGDVYSRADRYMQIYRERNKIE